MAPYELVVGTVDLAPRPDMLLSLDEAADLDRLAGRFSPRDLRRYALRKRHPLPTIRPGREYLTTSAWVDAWIDGMRMGAGQASGGTPAAAAQALAPAVSPALEARVAKLKASSSAKKRGK